MIRRFAIVLAATGLALACGSPEDKLERGLTVGQEEAVPGDSADFDETEAKRQAKQEAEESKKEIEEFDHAAGE